MERYQTGLLINPNNIKIHRNYFKEMCRLLGIQVRYRAPLPDTKQYNGYGELDAYYGQTQIVGVIYDEHPNQASLRKMGWNAELADSSVMIHVPYDLEGLQAGALFMLPAGIDGAPDRLFRVLRMQNIAVYPASIACELGPLLVNTMPKEAVTDFTESNFNLLNKEEGYSDNDFDEGEICRNNLMFKQEE